MTELSLDEVKKLAEKIEPAEINLAQRAATTNGLLNAARKDLSRQLPQTFSIEIETSPVQDQKRSGRCWLFASLNQIRHQMEQTLDLENVELSQTYPYFFSMLEKAAQVLEMAIEYCDEPLDSRWNRYIFYDFLNWGDADWLADAPKLFIKYGLCPREIMPDSLNAENSSALNYILQRVLRKGGLRLRQIGAENPAEIQSEKAKILADVYRILTIALGTPPRDFIWNYRTKKSKKFQRFVGTPREFQQKFASDLDYVQLRNNPAFEFDKLYQLNGQGEMSGVPLVFPNVEMPQLKQLMLKQLKSGRPVVIDAHEFYQEFDGQPGQFATDLLDYSGLAGIDLSLSRADRSRTWERLTEHNMTIVGADEIDGKVRAWKLENSWGDDIGRKGYWAATDAWLDENCFGAVIAREFLPDDILRILQSEPIQLEPWQNFA
ncbi:MAG: hypothetical protein LBM73_01380 [Candidatus Nomurabacteria bacterium]|jgi:bleomycin hydrolase|nr:hypothetical protein [Candidatus Nomurabacteria bacterium]